MMQEKLDVRDVHFKKGDYVLYYNLWTGHDVPAINKLFKSLSMRELLVLKPGDRVWTDEDPIHPNGKVYGYQLNEILQIEPLDKDEIRVYFKGGGFTTVSRKRQHKICKVNDKKLRQMVADHPLAIEI